MDEHLGCNQQDICDLNDEKTSITGGKSVSEIVQLLRTKAKLRISKGLEDNEDVDDQPSKSNQVFPWMGKFTALCREVILEPNIKKLDELITQFLKNVSEDVKQCYKKPKRAYKLRLRMNMFLMFFHMIYWEIRRPLEHTSYLDKMSDILAHYIDVEMKSSRRGREHPKKISERICTSLFLFLDKSPDHILDTVLKAKFFVKKYSDICVPVMARLLKENPGQMYENTYVRYLLSFKLWKKLAGKEHYININKEAVAKLKPPPDFAEKLKSGLFSNVLPYVSKSEKDRITLFFMQSPFNVKKKAQLFLKDGRRLQPTGDLEKAFLLEEDFNLSNLFDDDSQDDENNPDLMNEIWGSIMESEPESICLDDIFINDLNEDEKIIIDTKKIKSKEKPKKISKEKTNGVLKGTIKKRKSVKFNSCASVKNLLSKESSELIRTDKSKSLIPVTSKEDNSFPSVVKVEESLKKEDKPNLSSSQCSDQQKPQKPCATVEPEQCKEVEPDSQSKNTNSILVKSPQKLPFNHLEAKDDQFKKNSENSVRSLILNTDHNISLAVNAEVDVPSESADSSGICEEVKFETNHNEIFVLSNVYKDIKGDEVPMAEDQLVAEEVVIGTEISQDDVCTEFVIMDENGQGKLDQHDVTSVISISKDPAIFGTDSVIINTGALKKSPDNPEVQTEIVSLLENQNSVNCTNQLKGNCTKEQSSVSPENHQFLSSEISDNYVSIDRRLDCYIYNDIFLTRLFSEVNADDGSDDDNRCNNRSRYAGGGKIPAFRAQSEESKSDGGEEFESPSPASRSDSQRSTVETSPEIINTQPAQTDPNSQDYDQTDKSLALIPTQPKMVPEQKPTSLPLREVSVSLPYISGLDNLNDHLINKEKISPKGMCEPPNTMLHIKTVDDDFKFNFLQQQLYALYSTTQNILDTDPVPYPPIAIVSPSIKGYNRCPCAFCRSNFTNLEKNYKILYDMRSSRICVEVDKNRMLTKMFLDIDQNKRENDKLLKSIEETIPESEKPVKPEPTKSDELVSQPVSEKVLTIAENTLTIQEETPSRIVTEQVKTQIESRSEYSSLPPKKRKAFVPELETNECQIPETKKVKYDYINEQNLTYHSEDSTSEIPSVITSETEPLDKKQERRKDPVEIKKCQVVIDKFSPVKIKSVDGCYRVLPDNSVCPLNPSPQCEDIPEKKTKSRHEKCHKHHKRSKEERRLRKERKRLKKLKKQESSNN